MLLARRFWKGLFAGLLTLGFSVAAATAQEEESPPAAEATEEVVEETPPAAEEPPATQIATHKLEHCSPSQLQFLIRLLPGEDGQLPAERFARQNPGTIKVAVNERTKSLFVRGTEADLERVATLVTTFDKPVEELGEGAVAGLYVIPLNPAAREEAQNVLQQLQVPFRTAEMGTGQLLVFAEKAEGLEDAKEIVAALSVPVEEDEQTSAGGE